MKGKEKNMRVLYVLNTTVMGGGNISLINMLKGLNAKGIEIYIVYPERNIDAEFQREIKDIVRGYYHVRMHSYCHPRVKINHTILQKLKLCVIRFLCLFENINLKKIVNKVEPDIIHTNVGVIRAGFNVAKHYKIPHIWHIREYQTKDFDLVIEPSYDAFVSMLHQSYVVTITEDILSYFKMDSYSKAQCIYNGCCSKKDTCFDYPKEKYFLCCSRIARSKGHNKVLEAFSKFYVNHKDYKLIIAGFGDEDYITELKDFVIKEHIESAVEFIGYQNDVKSLMRKAQALIVASTCEGFGRMTAEASFYGCIVIGQNSGGTKEILENTGGFLYDDETVSLLERMNEVAELSESRYRNIVEKAHKIAVDSYSNEQNVEKVLQLYSKVTGMK